MMAVAGEGWEEMAQPELSIVFTSRLRVRLLSGTSLRTGLGLRSSTWKPGVTVLPCMISIVLQCIVTYILSIFSLFQGRS